MSHDRVLHVRVMRRLRRDRHAVELLTSYAAQMAVLATHARAKHNHFSRH